MIVGRFDDSKGIRFGRPKPTNGRATGILLQRTSIDAAIGIDGYVQQECPAGGSARKCIAGAQLQAYRRPIHADGMPCPASGEYTQCYRGRRLQRLADYDPAPATWVAEAAWITVWAVIVERASQP